MQRSRYRSGASGLAVSALLCLSGLCAAQDVTSAPQDSSPSASSPTKPSDAKRSEADRYVEIPIVGIIGKDVLAKGIIDALTPAKRRGVGHVVLVFDSPGGKADDARAIASALDSFANDFQFHAIIKGKVGGAALWALTACTDIHISTDAAAAGAPIITPDAGDSGENATMARDLAVRATARGMSGAGVLFAAVVHRPAAVYATGASGPQQVLSATKPADGAAQLIDGPETLLTIHAKLLLELGVAHTMPKTEPAELGDVIGLIGWKKSDSPSGIVAMKSASRELESMIREFERREERVAKIVQRLESAGDEIQTLKTAAQKLDPEQLRLSYYEDTGKLTAESARAWRDQSQRAIDAWENLQSRLEELDKDEKSHKSATDALARQDAEIAKFRRVDSQFVRPEMPRHNVSKDAEWTAASTELDRLRSRLNRTRI